MFAIIQRPGQSLAGSLASTRGSAYNRAMIRIAITPAAFEAVVGTLSPGSVGYENELSPKGERFIWLEPRFVDRLAAMRGPGESYSDVILRLVDIETAPRSVQGDETALVPQFEFEVIDIRTRRARGMLSGTHGGGCGLVPRYGSGTERRIGRGEKELGRARECPSYGARRIKDS